MGARASRDGTEQITILIRHSLSKANEWQHANKDSRGNLPKVTPEIATECDLFNAALSEDGILANHKHRGILWQHIRHVAGGRRIRIFCSPIKRVLQTVLESLDCDEASFLFQNGPPKVSPMALLCEKGSGSENDGIQLDKIIQDPDLDKELHGFHIGREIMDWKHFREHVWHESEQWWNVEFRQDVRRRATGLEKILRWRREGDWPERPEEGECIVCFTHWGFAKEVSGVDMANFGQDSPRDSQKLDRHAIREKLAPNAGWSWWRKSDEYDEVLCDS